MDIQKGNRVLVNVAPFIGSSRPGKDSIPCRVLSVKEGFVEVETEFPYRQLSIWVSSSWIETILEPDFCPPNEDEIADDKYFKASETRKHSSLMPA
jgi:hypothetical protein